MSVLKAKIGSVLAAVAATALLAGAPGAAHAQGLFESLWGGEPEHGGSRQSVKFNPQYKAGQIIVSFGDRRLYHVTRAGEAVSYPIAVPREQSRWQGATTVSSKRENPDWRPTPDMIKENPRLPSWVPGGHPMNPLGVRALYLGSSLYRIHGTDAPWTIGQAVSKGCIRMLNEDVLHLYPRVPTGTKVTVTWERFKTSPGAFAEVDARTNAASPSAPAAAQRIKPRRTTRSVATTPKTGFFVYEDDAAQGDVAAAAPAPAAAAPSNEDDEAVTVYTRNPDGTYSPDEAAPAPGRQSESVTRYNRKVGGSVSRSSQTAAVD